MDPVDELIAEAEDFAERLDREAEDYFSYENRSTYESNMCDTSSEIIKELVRVIKHLKGET